MRHAPAPLSFDDVGRAARALAGLPDLEGGALAALAWAAVNLWHAVSEDRDEPFPLSRTVERALQLSCAETPLAARSRSKSLWRVLSAIAAALAGDGIDPSGGATHFHHGSCAPDWALAKEPSCWIGRWAFYGGEPQATAVAAPAVNALQKCM